MAVVKKEKKKNEQKKKNKAAVVKTGIDPRLRNWIILAIILAYTFYLFAPSLKYQFINYDDDYYIINNPLIKNFSFEGFGKIFVTPVIGMYNPLTFLVYAFIYHFWDLKPVGYYLVNILLHLLAIIGAFRFVYTLTRRYETASIVALLFAIHPMHAAVVAWVSETKTSLYSVFYFFALINYIHYCRSRFKVKYLVYTGVLFILALLSKPSAVTLAPMILLIDYYLGRKRDKKMFLEKIPFFMLSLFFGLLTFFTHMKAEDTIFEANNFSFANNLFVSNYSLAFYLNKVLVPIDLSAIYTYPKDVAWLPLKYYISILTVPFALWLIYKSGKFRKEMIFGFLFFIISISVVLRIVPSGFFRASNVYTYMSYTGLFFIIGQFFTYTLDKKIPHSTNVKKIVIVVLGVLTVFYSIGAVARIKVWENNITFFNDILRKNPSFALAYNGRGQAKMQMGDVAGAIADYSKCIELDAGNSVAHNNRGKLLFDLNDHVAALKDFNEAIRIDSLFAEAYLNRGIVKFKEEKYDEALIDYNLAIKNKPTMAESYQNRSLLKKLKNDYEGALEDINIAIDLNPDLKIAAIDKGRLLFAMGRPEEARQFLMKEGDESYSKELYNKMGIGKMDLDEVQEAVNDFSKAIELDNHYSTAYSNRGVAFFRLGKHDDAMRDLDIALRLDSSNADAYINRGIVKYNLAKYDEALSDYNLALTYNPELAVGYRKRSMIKVLKKDYAGAMEDLDKALALNPRFENAYIDKGQVMYLQGKYQTALRYVDTAIRINPSNKDAYNNRAVIKMALKDTAGAHKDGQKAAELKQSANPIR